jgi:hypothetical protein
VFILFFADFSHFPLFYRKLQKIQSFQSSLSRRFISKPPINPWPFHAFSIKINPFPPFFRPFSVQNMTIKVLMWPPPTLHGVDAPNLSKILTLMSKILTPLVKILPPESAQTEQNLTEILQTA